MEEKELRFVGFLSVVMELVDCLYSCLTVEVEKNGRTGGSEICMKIVSALQMTLFSRTAPLYCRDETAV